MLTVQNLDEALKIVQILQDPEAYQSENGEQLRHMDYFELEGHLMQVKDKLEDIQDVVEELKLLV